MKKLYIYHVKPFLIFISVKKFQRPDSERMISFPLDFFLIPLHPRTICRLLQIPYLNFVPLIIDLWVTLDMLLQLLQ